MRETKQEASTGESRGKRRAEGNLEEVQTKETESKGKDSGSRLLDCVVFNVRKDARSEGESGAKREAKAEAQSEGREVD